MIAVARGTSPALRARMLRKTGVALVVLGVALAPIPRLRAQQRGAGRSSPAAWLAWRAPEGQPASTVWIDPDGSVRGPAHAAIIAARGTLFRFEINKRRVRLPTCEQLEEQRADVEEQRIEAARRRAQDPPAGHFAILRRAVLEEIGGTQRIVLIDHALAEARDSAVYDQRVELVASLGPYAFVRSTDYSYGCDLHGNVSASITAIDLRSDRPPSQHAPRFDAPRAARRLRQRARAIFEQERPDSYVEVEGEFDPVQLAASFPTFQGGRVAMARLFELLTCYLCTDGSWSSYTRTTRIDDPRVPAALARHARWPAPVARTLAATPPSGVSAVSARDVMRARLLFDRIQ